MRKALILASLLATALLGGCEARQIPGVYRIDVQQGNVVTPEQIARLEPGMEQRKVRFIMGSPLLIDVFNQERWDYVYEFRPGSFFGDPVHRRVSLYFENELLARVEGDVEPASREELDVPRDRVVTVPDLPRDDGFFSGLNPFRDEPSPLPPREEPATGAVGVENPAEAAIEADAAADAAADEAPPPEQEEPIPDAADQGAGNAPARAPADREAESNQERGFFRSLADGFGFGDGEAAPAE